MSARSSIANAIVEKLKAIDGTGIYITNLFSNAFALHKFWDEVNDFPCVYVVPGPETREYLPGGFKWGFLSIYLKIYVKEENPVKGLEDLLQDIEKVLDSNRNLIYNLGKETTEILITSIVTDEGLLIPYGVGEVTLNVRYQIL